MAIMKMTIDGFSDSGFSTKEGSYEVMLNPDNIKLDRKIDYNTEQAPDKSQPSVKYDKTNAMTLSFDLVIDCTGVVDNTRIDLPKEIADLLNVVYNYHGEIHRPYFVIISWGLGDTFKGVLTTFNTHYTLFNADGIPLRAKVSLSFTSYLDPKSVSKTENKASPDLTHLVTVRLGDALPSISQKIYNKPDYFIQIAEFNGLDKFRRLQAGTQLIVPPLIPKGTAS